MSQAKIDLLVAACRCEDPDRKRSVSAPDRKSSKNKARYMLNLVAETAERNDIIHKYTAQELLAAAQRLA